MHCGSLTFSQEWYNAFQVRKKSCGRSHKPQHHDNAYACVLLPRRSRSATAASLRRSSSRRCFSYQQLRHLMCH